MSVQKIVIASVILLTSIQLASQTWATYLDEITPFEYINDVIETRDRGFLVASYTQNESDIVLVKLDSLGEKVWSKVLNYKYGTSSWSEIEPHILLRPSGEILIGATTYPNTSPIDGKLIFWRLQPNGETIDSSLSSPMYLKSFFQRANGDYVVAGNYYDCQWFECDELRSIYILDSTFNIIFDLTWPWPINHSEINPVLDCIELSDGRLVLLGGKVYWDGEDWQSTTFLEIYESDTYEYSTLGLEEFTGGSWPHEGSLSISDEKYLIVGYNDGNRNRLKRIDLDEYSEEWNRYVEHDVSRFTIAKDGAVLLVGTNQPGDTTIHLQKFWPNGFGLEWNNMLEFKAPQNIHPAARIEIRKIIPTDDDGFVLVGFNQLYYPQDSLDGFVIKVDREGNKSSIVNGHIRADINPANCISENSEPGLEQWIVEASGVNTSVYATSDSKGKYSIKLPETDCKLYFYKTGIDSSLVCQYGMELSLRNKIDYTELNVAVQGYSSCPLVSIDAGIPLVRNCTTNTYTVRYCNFGFSKIDTLVFKLDPSQYMEFIAASLPYEFYDSAYVFAVYNLDPGECRSLSFSVFLDCQSPAGWEHCLKAQILLDSLCILNPNLSQDPLSDTDCQTSGMPFDPNDKMATPIGEGSNREIPSNSQINYTIRFQNIGTDTAFQVVIRDTLDNNLAIGSFRPGVSSHDYDWQLIEGGILEFTFRNIQLPDSSIDAERSQGFVTFSILPRPFLIPGTKIQNVASIYFDYTQPIVTNVVSQTIRKEIVSFEFDTIVCPSEYVYGIVVDSDSSWTEINEGVYTDTLIHIHTMVWPSQDSIFNWDFCQWDIDSLSGNPFGEAGVFNETLHFTNQFGCDSTHNYSFTIHPVSNDTVWLEFPSGSLYKDIILERDTILVEQDTSSHGCTIQLTEIISVLSTGIAEINAENLYSINPNPFSSCFWIQPKSDKSIIKAISLSDLVGQYYFQFDSNDTGPDQGPRCEISDWPSGLYLLQLQDEEGIGVYPILKIK